MAQDRVYCLLAGTLLILAVLASGAPVSKTAEKYDVVEQPFVFEGDMIENVPRAKFASMEDETEYWAGVARNGLIRGRWPDNKMYYEISDSFTEDERQAILAGVKEINAKSEYLKLIPRTIEPDYAFIARGAPGTGCSATVGRAGGKQSVNLAVPSCLSHGTIVHELIHGAGFRHEQTRTDRDDYVDINWGNIQAGKEGNFRKYDAATITAFGQPYDYGSVMHYGTHGFAIDREVWTMRPKEPNQNVPIGQRVGLSPIDITKLNLMYSPNQ